MQDKYHVEYDLQKSTNTAIERSNLKHKQEIERLFRTAYYVAKDGLAFTKYEKLCKLQQLNRLDIGENYLSSKACSCFIASISSDVKKNISEEFNNCRFVTVLSDGSTDAGR